jgi:hypothetical protein
MTKNPDFLEQLLYIHIITVLIIIIIFSSYFYIHKENLHFLKYIYINNTHLLLPTLLEF